VRPEDATVASQHAAFLRRVLHRHDAANHDHGDADEFASPDMVTTYLCPPERELTPGDFAVLARRPSADEPHDRAELADDGRAPDAREFAAAFRFMRAATGR
jgi:hypothetical protein